MRRIFMLSLFVLLAACSNSTDERNATPNSQSIEADSPSVEDATSDKEKYLKILEETKQEVENMRNNPIDDTTFAMKKIEGDIFDIWDGLLNEIYRALKEQLSSEEMEELTIEQRAWIEYRDKTAKEQSLKYEGGTMEQLEYVIVMNNLTEERCFELVEQYMR